MENIIEYKCPNCGAKLEFDSDSQQMKCPYCDSVFATESFVQQEEQLFHSDADFECSSSGSEWQSGESTYNLYHCDSCGAEIIADETTAAMHCPYCDSPVILTGRLAGELKPDVIIPFKLDKKAAKAALENHLKGKKLLPKVFTSQNHLDEVKGVYVPFWLFDTTCEVEASYRMKRSRTWTDSRFQYTETEDFTADRSGRMDFTNVPVDGASNMPDELMESLEVFDCSDAVEFKPAYLSGFYANRYDVSMDDCKIRAKERIFKSANSALRDSVSGYESVVQTGGSGRLVNTRVRYALFPVWILNTTWNDTRYTFAMNGQTGKFVGNLPIDKRLSLKYRLLYTLAFGGGLFLLTQLAGMFL